MPSSLFSHDGFVATHALGHMMYSYIHTYTHIYIYIYIICNNNDLIIYINIYIERERWVRDDIKMNLVRHKELKTVFYFDYPISIYLLKYISAASTHVLVMFEQYGHPKKCTPKNVFWTFFPYMVYVKMKWNSLQILRDRNLFKRLNYPPLILSDVGN